MEGIKKYAFFILILFVLILFVSVLVSGEEFEVKVVKSAEDLPEKFCTIWKEGDFLISDGQTLTLIGGSQRTLKTTTNSPTPGVMGSIISFVPAGKNLESTLVIGSPSFRIKDKREDLSYTQLRPLKEKTPGGAFAFEATSLYTGKKGEKARIKTLYHFFPDQGRVDVLSALTNTGGKDLEGINYSPYCNAFCSYSFSPFQREKHPELNFRVYQKKGHYLAWLNLTPLPEKEESGVLKPKDVFETRHILLVDTRFGELLQKAYQILNVRFVQASIHFKDSSGSLMEVIVSDALSSSVFFRSMLDDPFSVQIPLPEGTYKVRANFFPAVSEELMVVAAGKENSCLLQNPPHGRVKVKIQDSQGKFVPGKATFIGLAPTPTPYFKPENPIKSGKNWESFKNSCFPPEEGLELKLPAGTYLASASRGPEYSLDQKAIEILKDELLELVFRIDRVVKTPNLIALDPHLHTLNSDGQMRIPERIKSVVAEGVEVAVASDHNFISDYAPALKTLGLNQYLAVLYGNEVTTSYVLHFNTYPLKYRPEEEGNGAIDPVSDEASPLFEASREKDPGAILQVNHPRAGTLGYFNNYQLDLESAAYARENFDTSFDVLEIMNGPYFYSSNSVAIEDWFHLLNRGYYFPLIGSSDSHSIDRGEPGYSRTYVFYEGEGGDDLNWEAVALSIKKGRSFASNGPIIEFKVNNSYLPGDSFTSRDGKVDIWIKVQSAPWIAVNEVRVIVNGERKVIFPVQTAKEVIPKFEETFSLKLRGDSYIAIEVLGKESLYPVLQRSSWTGLAKDATLPYALTNPVFVDVDGNGKYDPPLSRKIDRKSDIPQSKELIPRH